MAHPHKIRPRTGKSEELFKPQEAALELQISSPTIKQWIYKKKIRSIQTAGAATGSRKARLTGSYIEPEPEPTQNESLPCATSVAETNWSGAWRVCASAA